MKPEILQNTSFLKPPCAVLWNKAFLDFSLVIFIYYMYKAIFPNLITLQGVSGGAVG
jgi:hypothetical protein